MRKAQNFFFKQIISVLFFSLVILLWPQGAKQTEKDKFLFSADYEPDNNTAVPLLPFDSIPDSSLLRKLIAGVWLLDSPSNIMLLENSVYTDDDGKNFKVRAAVSEETDRLAVVINPFHTEFSGAGSDNVPQGTWILFREFKSGKPVEIKIYPRETTELYIRLYPGSENANSFIDICLFNAYVRKEQPLSVPFESLYYFSLKDLRNITQETVPWSIFDPPISYGAVEYASDVVSERLSRLVFLEDAGFDENGVPIHLKDGSLQTKEEIISALKEYQEPKEVIGGVNCSGFAKWIVDGIVRPIAGQGIFLKPLKDETEITETHFNSPYIEARNLFFGLDWIRNLAAAALSLNVKRTVKPLGSGVDVREEPFAIAPPVKNILSKKVVTAFKGYSLNNGYQTEYLQAILYYLAVTEPGHFYLGAVNRDSGSPPLRQYHHIAVFFPYFDTLGNFHIDVYESGEKTSISLFIRRNADAFTALTRIRAPEIGLFNP